MAIARALVTGTSVVFADEPTGALDSATSSEVMEVLRGATRAVGAARQAAAYQALALVAAVLVVVPLLVLAEAAARLGVARRDLRLAALRLAGATPRQVMAMTAFEAGVTALAGALLGLFAALLVTPLAARVPVAGGRWYAADMVPALPVLGGLVAAVAALAVVSSTSALGPVLAGPLGVASSHTPRRLSQLRVAGFAVLVVGFLRYAESDGASDVVLVLAFAAVFAALAVVGPWVVGLLGRVVVSRSSSAAALLAGACGVGGVPLAAGPVAADPASAAD